MGHDVSRHFSTRHHYHYYAFSTPLLVADHHFIHVGHYNASKDGRHTPRNGHLMPRHYLMLDYGAEMLRGDALM